MKNSLLIIALFLSLLVQGQSASNFNSSRNWSLNKKEIFFTIGATQFLGDLGGMDRVGTTKSPVDIDWNMTRGGIGFGYRYRFHPMWAWSTQLYGGLIQGDDASTNEIVRRSRNLSFRSPIIEFSNRIEAIIYANEKAGARFKHNNLKGSKTNSEVIYLFTGISGVFFNPQGNINGTWTNLQPLKTEGQGLPGGADEYSRLTVAIPFGVGVKIGIGRFWRIGLEVIYNKTFTDYMDDVSTVYYDPAILAAQVSPEAAFASNTAIENHNWFVPGQQRGNPDDNDAFLLTNVVLTRNITYPKPKGGGKIKWKSRTKF